MSVVVVVIVFVATRAWAVASPQRRLLGAALVPRDVLCDDSCIFEPQRIFDFGGRQLVLAQEFESKAGTGMGVWECSEVLSQLIARRPEVVSHKRVLEVGCGCGLASMVSAMSGGRVTASDGDDEVLQLARRNFDANGLSIETRRLRWEEATAMAAAKFEVVLGADVTYFPGSALPLANVMLASAAPVAYLAHKRRTAQDDETLATLARYFEPHLLEVVDRSVSVFRYDRRPRAPPDLADVLGTVQCNDGYRRVGSFCSLL
ncbi:hypothetical protein CTAYLR_002062 [Chrysophaeum taylorii]|uniref:Calmodulin-lysine N-methyltransferase n=1 Tax=Chrysophaeum taylorii TaxID=2483200 RepID=A0AAD7XTX1_9STRA|nr:hypothetical protein CTAYLR_002062 [Chrysophaeum taylorii]